MAELAAQGMPQRDIADVLGADPATVNRDLKPPVANATEPVPKPQVDEPYQPAPVANATEPEAEAEEDDEPEPEPMPEPDPEPVGLTTAGCC